MTQVLKDVEGDVMGPIIDMSEWKELEKQSYVFGSYDYSNVVLERL